MTPSEFRRHGHALVEWIAAFFEHPDRYPVLARVRPGEVRSALPASPPEAPETFDAVLADFERVLLPGITHWNHPGFFAYFATTGSAPGVLAEFLSAALNVQAMLWRTSPAATELEELSLDWLRQLMGLPPEFRGVIYDTASISTLHALAAARERFDPMLRLRGMSGTRLRVYCSEQAHSSVDKSVILLGLGHEALRRIPTDEAFALRPEALDDALAEDRAAGWHPLAVVGTAGTTSSTAIDPLPAIAHICSRAGLWFHVDAAYGGAAALVPEWRDHLAGMDLADSIVVNPHKWLFTPFDLSAFYTRHMDVLRRAFSLVPEYLRTPEPDVANLMDTGIQLGRRFRALKLWAVLRCFGADGLRAQLREHGRLARLFADWIDDDPGFERLAPVPFSVVCFRACPAVLAGDEAALARFNAALLARVNAAGRVFLSHTMLRDQYVLRLAVGNLRTTESHVRLAWDLLRADAGYLERQTA